MKLLITGGAGYIGYRVADILSANKHVNSILLYDNLTRHIESFLFSPLHDRSKVRLVRSDILDTRTLQKEMEGIDVVIHLAARVTTPFANQDAHYFEQVNHWGTAEVVYAAEKANVKKVIYVSSTAVYGRAKQPCSTDTIPEPQSYYAVSKFRGEEHVQRLVDKGIGVIVRCGNVYGYSPTLRFDAVINNFMLQANIEGRISIHGDGLQKRSFVHIDEVSQVLSSIATNKIKSGVYNYISKTLSIEEVADIIVDVFPKTERIYINQHVKMRSLVITNSEDLVSFVGEKKKSLKSELSEFKSGFSLGRMN